MKMQTFKFDHYKHDTYGAIWLLESNHKNDESSSGDEEDLHKSVIQ